MPSRSAQSSKPTASPDELLTPRQVHERYGFSTQTLANWRWCGHGPSYIKTSPSRSGRVKYRKSAIEAWLNAQTVSHGGDVA